MPQYFEHRPAPLRLVQEGTILDVSRYEASPTVEAMRCGFGAVAITDRFPLDEPLNRWLDRSESRYENDRLLTDSRTRLERLLRALSPAIERLMIAEEVGGTSFFDRVLLGRTEPGQNDGSARMNHQRLDRASIILSFIPSAMDKLPSMPRTCIVDPCLGRMAVRTPL